MQPAPHSRTHQLPVAALALALALAGASAARAFDDQLEAGIEGGYSNLTLRSGSSPALTMGGGGGVRVRYGLTDWLGVVFAGRMNWYSAYRTSINTTVADPEDPEGEPIPAVVHGPPVERINVRSFAFSILYSFDVMRVVPFFALGVVSARISEEHAKTAVVDHELGLRTDLGADYALLDHLSIGATIGADTYLTNRSAYVSQFDIVVRISFLWDVGILGR